MNLPENPINTQIVELLQSCRQRSPDTQTVSSIIEFASDNRQFLDMPGLLSNALGWTPLILTIMTLGTENPLYKGLTDLGADKFAWDAHGNTLLSYTIPGDPYRQRWPGREAFNNTLEEVNTHHDKQKIIDAALACVGYQLNRHNEDHAVRLIEKGADPNLKLSYEGGTISILQLAILKKSLPVTLKLLAANADCNVILPSNGDTVLGLVAGACAEIAKEGSYKNDNWDRIIGFTNAANTLIAHGADLYASNYDGITPYDKLWRADGLQRLIRKSKNPAGPRLEL